jgi:2,3,4,5-tetrahydropyridine-2,6-dicarboxylate N-succinyltransferase
MGLANRRQGLSGQGARHDHRIGQHARDVELMASFVDLGAYVDEKTMVDTWVTIGSCAQIGKTCISRGASALAGCWSRRAGNHRQHIA